MAENAILETSTAPQPDFRPPALAVEVMGLIAEMAVPLPSTIQEPPHDYLPIIYPENPTPPRSNFMAFAKMSWMAYKLVMLHSWRHVVLSSASEARGILTRGTVRDTRRLDLHLPPSHAGPHLMRIFHQFTNLSHIVWDHVSIKHVGSFLQPCLPTVERLQIGALPAGTRIQTVLDIARIFPGLHTLQIVTCRGLFEESSDLLGPTTDAPLFPQLTTLAVGPRTNLMPGRHNRQNKFLECLCLWEAGTVCPQLVDLRVEKTVSGVGEFLRKHGGPIRSIAYSTDADVFYESPSILGVLPNVNTIVLQVDETARAFPVLPKMVQTVVLVQPFLPTCLAPWVTLDLHLMRALRSISSIPGRSHARVVCERGGPAVKAVVDQEMASYVGTGIEFEVFDFCMCIRASCVCQSLTGSFSQRTEAGGRGFYVKLLGGTGAVVHWGHVYFASERNGFGRCRACFPCRNSWRRHPAMRAIQMVLVLVHFLIHFEDARGTYLGT